MFSASYDTTTKVISAVALLVFLVIVVATHSLVVGCLIAVILVGAYAWSPRGYTVANGCIEVNRLVGNARIPLDGVHEVRAATKDDFRGCLKLFGNGGLFGYYGLFRTSKLGKSTWYVTNRGKVVVVVTGKKTALFSPDDVGGFIAAIGAPTPGPVTQDAGSRIPTLIGAAIGIVAMAVVAFALLYSPGPPSYTLTSESLTINDRFYPVTLNAASVDVEHIRVIEFGVDTEWQPTERTNGFGNPHYASGWFRVASGQTVRMYRAGSTRLVLLPPKSDGAAVLLETREPEKFVVEVREKWGGHS